MAWDDSAPALTRRELLRRERARFGSGLPGAPEDATASGADLIPLPEPSPVALPPAEEPPTSPGPLGGDLPEPPADVSRVGRRRAADRPGGSMAGMSESVTDLMFALRTRPWLFLDVVDLAMLTGRSRQEVCGGVELLSGRGLIRTATRGNRLCYAAAS
jgi:hypothetical protein